MTTLLKSALIFDETSPYHKQIKDILISNGSIEKIANSIPAKDHYKILALDNLHVSCGWFDTSVSFGEPGYEERETISHGLNVAAKSGFTAVAVNPNTNPVVDNKSAVGYLLTAAKGAATQLYPVGTLTKQSQGKDLAELYDMQQAGAIAFSDYSKPIENDNLLKIGLQYAQNFNGKIMSFPLNKSIANDGVANEGIESTRLGLKGSPALAEHLQINRDLFLLEYTGGSLHIPTISTKESVALIKAAKKKGLKVSCSVAAHHLCLDDSLLEGFDSNIKVHPPLRTLADVKALRKAVADGVIDSICSDHNPIDIEHKKLEFSLAEDGTVGLESLFGSVNAVISLEHTIPALTTKPRTAFELPHYSIKEGSKADLTLFNPAEEYLFGIENITSTSKNSAFIGTKCKGKVYGIFANKKLVLS